MDAIHLIEAALPLHSSSLARTAGDPTAFVLLANGEVRPVIAGADPAFPHVETGSFYVLHLEAILAGVRKLLGIGSVEDSGENGLH